MDLIFFVAAGSALLDPSFNGSQVIVFVPFMQNLRSPESIGT